MDVPAAAHRVPAASRLRVWVDIQVGLVRRLVSEAFSGLAPLSVFLWRSRIAEPLGSGALGPYKSYGHLRLGRFFASLDFFSGATERNRRISTTPLIGYQNRRTAVYLRTSGLALLESQRGSRACWENVCCAHGNVGIQEGRRPPHVDTPLCLREGSQERADPHQPWFHQQVSVAFWEAYV